MYHYHCEMNGRRKRTFRDALHRGEWEHVQKTDLDFTSMKTQTRVKL